MQDLSVSFSFSDVFVLLGIGASVTVAFFTYRRTVPPISRSLRWFLAVLRCAALSALVLLIGKPVLSLLTRSSTPPVVALVVDNSASMALSGDTDPRATIQSIVESEAVQSVRSSGDVRTYLFDERLRDVEDGLYDSLKFDGERSDIAGMFRAFRRDAQIDNLQAVVLLTDGNPTTPVHPVYDALALGVPVYTIGIGDTAVQKDLVLSDVQTNSIAYAGTRVPVHVTVRSAGFSGEQATLTLSTGGATVSRTALNLQSGMREYRIVLFVTPDSAGMFRGDVRITPFDGEVTHRNNIARFAVRVLSGKRRILLLGGSPNPDLAFLRRSLSADSNLAVTLMVEAPNGRILGGPLEESHLRSADAMVLVGFPGPYTTAQTLGLFRSAPVQRKPVFVILSRTTEPDLLRQLGGLIPFSIRSVAGQERSVFVTMPDASRRHPLLRTTGDGAWRDLPPLFASRSQFTPDPDASVLLFAGAQPGAGRDPFLIARTTAGARSIAVLGYGLWRWSLLSADGSDPDNAFHSLVGNAVRWLTAVDDQRRFRVNPSQDIFTSLESPVLQAELYDETMRPADDARIAYTVTGGSRRYTGEFAHVANGQYEATLDALAPGEYRFTASVVGDGTTASVDSGSFEVGDLNAEYVETRLHRDLLQNLSFRTGGSYFSASGADSLDERILSLPTWRPEEQTLSRQVELWHDPWLLGAILLLLTTEWTIRKRVGLL